RFQKLVRRNKAAFSAAVVIVVTLFSGLAISTYSLAREKLASHAARAEAAKREQLARFLQDLLARISSQVAQGLDTSKLKTILAQTSSRFAESLKEKPGIEAELWASVGAIYLDLGDYGTAAQNLERALRLKSSSGETASKAVADLFNMLGNALEMR